MISCVSTVNSDTLVWLFLSLAEVEAQRTGSAAHCQRPVSGQPDSCRTTSHHSMSPPGGRTVLGAADYQLIAQLVRGQVTVEGLRGTCLHTWA